MQLQLANFVRGRLSAGITAAATSIPLTTAAFPALAQGAFCYAVLQSAADRSVVEIVKVTAGGATLTVERGQEGTTARDFAANDIIEQRLTAVQFQSVVDHSNAASSHVPAGEAGKFLKGVVGGAPVWGIPTASEVGALPISGGSLTGALGVQTINGQGSSTSWASIDVTGIKGGYAGFNFPDTGHWFGVRADGLSGIWNSAGTSKWYFNADGVLTGGAKILWDTIIDHPSRTNWASKAYIPAIVTGQLAWKNYGNSHTIFDASAGTSPDGTAIDKTNSQIAWSATHPTLMGWNGANTYGVRVDSARRADSAGWADGAAYANRLNGDIIKTNGQDLTFWDKRAMVGDNAANQLVINYGNDWGSTAINGNVFTGPLQSGRLLAIKNGSTVYSDSQIEARSTDGSDARIGFHQAGVAAGAINFSSWGFQFEREAGRGSRANVAAANFFADAAQDMTGNALTRKDYVDGALSSKFDKTGGTISGEVVINANAIRGANGAAIVRDHGNGNTTFSGSRNASSVAGDLYLGYHDNTTHFTNKVLLCKSMYSEANQNLQIIDHSNGALFDKGAAVIGANRDNVLNNSSFGVGFLSAADSGAQWIAGYFGKNGGANQVVVGELNGGAVIGGHNAAKNAWAPIAINPGASGAETTYIGMFANQASGSGNLFVGNDVEANYMRLRSDIPNDSRYVVNRGYVDGNFIKRRARLHPDDGTSLDNVQQEHGFNYSTSGGIFGPYISFGGLGGNYECQINADYISGNDIKFRTHNGDLNRWNSWRTIWNSGNFDPDTKLSNNGSGGTLYLNNWFRSTGVTGWYNETYGGGIWMDEATTVKVYNGKKFSVANNENNSISSAGGIFSYQRFTVDTRQQIGNGGSFNAYRSIDAPFHAGHGGLDAGTFAPIVGSANYTNGQGYTTRVHLGVRTVGADWTHAVLMVGSAESTSHPCATYEFDAYGNMTGLSTISLSGNANIGGAMVCNYAYANGAQPQVANALTRKDYVDEAVSARNAASASKWETARTLSFTGHAFGSMSVDGSGNASAALTLASTGIAAGTYKSVTVDTKGRAIAGTNPTTLAGYGITDALSTTGNAASASKLANARIFSIGGISKSFDGTGNVSWSSIEINSAVAYGCDVESTNVPWVGSIALVARVIAAYGTAPTLNYGDTVAGSSLKVASVAGGVANNATQACTGTWKVLSFFGAFNNGTANALMQSGLAIRIA